MGDIQREAIVAALEILEEEMDEQTKAVFAAMAVKP